MARKPINLSSRACFTALMILSIGLLLLPQNITKGLNFLFVRTFNPLLNIGRDTVSRSERFKPLEKNSVPRSEYDRLQTDYWNLHADYLTLHQRYEKLARFRAPLPDPGPALVLADVTSTNATALQHEFIINRGRDDGLKEGQYVLAEHSVIGAISETDRATARVRLVTDTKHKIEVRIWRVGAKKQIGTQMVGSGSNSCKIRLLSREYKVQTGDTVYAAARPGFLDTPRVIGQVTEVKSNEKNPLLLDITVQPIQNLDKLATVAVIVDTLESPEN